MTRKCRTSCEDLLAQTAQSFPEIDTPGMRFIARVLRLRDIIFENAQKEMAHFDLSAAEYSVLATLRRTPHPHELRPSDIYKGMLLSSGGLTKVLKNLEERRLVERYADTEDRRGSRIRLSQQGIELAQAAMQSVISSDIAMLEKAADADQLAELADAMKRFTDRLD